MSFELTENAELASQEGSLTPNIVLEIEGVSTVFGTVSINKFLQYGDPYNYGDNIVYGGLIPIEDQKPYISFGSGTTTTIKQTLNIDRGTGESISSITVALIDKNEEITQLITPGNTISEILGRKCKLWMGFESTSFKEDYITIFRGNINSVESKPGVILFKILHPDNKKNSGIFPKAETDLTSDITAASTVLNVTDETDFLVPQLGPDLAFDPSIEFYVRIDDEVIRYESTTANQFTTLTRGALDTVATTHSSGTTVESFIRLVGNPLTLALKIMASGKNDAYSSGVDVTHFGRISPTEAIDDVIFFKGINIETETSVVLGDYVTTTGASEAANNISLLPITGITQTNDGSYITITGAGLVDEPDSSAVIDFRSQYDTLGEGLKMSNDEIDIAEHVRIEDRFLSSADMDIYVKDTIDDVKSFISDELYNPVGCFSLPRKSQSSLGIHNPPLPDATIKIFDNTNVKNASKIKIERSLTRNFFNAVIYKYDELVLEQKFISGLTTIDGDSLLRFGDNVGNKVLSIESKGLRGGTAQNIANIATQRRLKKYKFGAESIRQMDLSFSDGFNIEVGDVLLLEMDGLKISDIQTGTRSGEPRLWEVENKSINLKTGDISIALTDTSFDKDARFALISPASKIKSGTSGTQFVIEESYRGTFGVNEFKKYEGLKDLSVIVRSLDYVTVGTSIVDGFSGNTVNLQTDLGFTPTAGMIMEFDDYSNQPDTVKLLYGFMSDDDNDFSDGGKPYEMF